MISRREMAHRTLIGSSDKKNSKEWNYITFSYFSPVLFIGSVSCIQMIICIDRGSGELLCSTGGMRCSITVFICFGQGQGELFPLDKHAGYKQARVLLVF